MMTKITSGGEKEKVDSLLMASYCRASVGSGGTMIDDFRLSFR